MSVPAVHLITSGECTPACLLARNVPEDCRCRCGEEYHGGLLLAEVEEVDRDLPLLQRQLNRALGVADLTTIEGRGAAGLSAAAIVAQHPNDLVRAEYVKHLAARLLIDERALRNAVARAKVDPAKRRRFY